MGAMFPGAVAIAPVVPGRTHISSGADFSGFCRKRRKCRQHKPMAGYKAFGTGIRNPTSLVPGQATPEDAEPWAILVVAFARLVNSRPRESLIDPLEDGPAMNLDRDRHAEAPRREPGTEAAIARYYRDFLLGRALPADDH